MDKRGLRERFIKERDNLTDRAEKSAVIMDKLSGLREYVNARVVFCFLSFGSEADTSFIVKDAIAGKSLYVPKIIGKAMRTVKIDSNTEFKPGAFGILEPCAPPSDITPDVVIVPSVALSYGFDRLGYGAGYYDKYLADKQTVKVAINFDCFLLPSLPTENHDILMDIIITECRVIRRTNEG